MYALLVARGKVVSLYLSLYLAIKNNHTQSFAARSVGSWITRPGMPWQLKLLGPCHICWLQFLRSDVFPELINHKIVKPVFAVVVALLFIGPQVGPGSRSAYLLLQPPAGGVVLLQYSMPWCVACCCK